MKSLVVMITLGFLLGCVGIREDSDSASSTPPQETYRYKIPKNLNDGWSVGRPQDHNLDVTKLETLVNDRLQSKFSKIHSISIVRHGQLILDEYFQGRDVFATTISGNTEYPLIDEEYLHIIQSSTKSILSVAFGAAEFQGIDIDLEESLAHIYGEKDFNWTGYKGEVKLKHALTMSSGVAWDEWQGNSLQQFYDAVYSVTDPVRYMFNLDYVHTPGDKFTYCSGMVVVLGDVLRKKTGMGADQFCENYLFAPMQIESTHWVTLPGGFIECQGGLYLRARDLLKFPQLFINGGVWQGVRLLSQAWVDQSVKTLIMSEVGGYGLLWWIGSYSLGNKTFSTYETQGAGGQMTVTFPELGLIVGFTGGYYQENFYPVIDEIIKGYILPSVTNLN